MARVVALRQLGRRAMWLESGRLEGEGCKSGGSGCDEKHGFPVGRWESLKGFEQGITV